MQRAEPCTCWKKPKLSTALGLTRGAAIGPGAQGKTQYRRAAWQRVTL